jgi:hypothetical protein
MATAKGFRRQAATCAALAAATDDEESRQRYKRLEQMYHELAGTEEALTEQAGAFTGDNAGGFAGDNKSEPVAHRVN